MPMPTISQYQAQRRSIRTLVEDKARFAERRSMPKARTPRTAMPKRQATGAAHSGSPVITACAVTRALIGLLAAGSGQALKITGIDNATTMTNKR